ncbi:MAG: response regulator [Steroidobacteraceae bacterium]
MSLIASPVKLLIVDDIAENLIALEALLRQPELAIHQARSATEALELLLVNDFALAILDVQMPDMDGFQLAEMMRGTERTRRIPIIFVTAGLHGPQRIFDGYEAGAVDFLTKPIDPRILRHKVDTFIELFRQRQQLASQLAVLREAEELRSRVRTLEDQRYQLLSAVFRHAPVGLALVRGRPATVEFCNTAFGTLLGRSEAIVGQQLASLLPQVAQVANELRDDTDLEPRVERTLRIGERDYDVMLQPLGATEGEAAAVVVFDVTDLARARHEADVANRAKDEFLAMLGHELRNPLAPIVTALHLMQIKCGALASEERAIIDRQVRHMVRLVDDLLDVSRITRGKLDLNLEPVDLADIVAKAAETAEPLIGKRKHTLELAVPTGFGVMADPVRLAQVLLNLLTNAARYTEPGGRITVSAERHDDRIVLDVTDTGVGIRAEMLDTIFKLFVQEEQDLSRSQGGLGLGLAIAQSFAQLHGGELTAHSDGPGKGSTFRLSLPTLEAADAPRPITASPDDTLPSEAARPRQRRRVLVVDDNRDVATMFAAALTELGHTTEIAHDAADALRRAESFRPEFGVLDVGLPGTDGLSLARSLRRVPGLERLKLIAVSGYGQAADRTRSLAAGMDEHLVKPVEIERLDAVIARLDAAANS